MPVSELAPKVDGLAQPLQNVGAAGVLVVEPEPADGAGLVVEAELAAAAGLVPPPPPPEQDAVTAQASATANRVIVEFPDFSMQIPKFGGRQDGQGAAKTSCPRQKMTSSAVTAASNWRCEREKLKEDRMVAAFRLDLR
jgi:hypothetical protein